MKKSNDDHFQKSHCFRQFLLQICYFCRFSTFFFSKSPSFFMKRKTFWKTVIIQSHSTTFLLSLAILKNSCFFWKNSFDFSIKINFWTFWEFLLFLSHSTANLPKLAHFIYFKTLFPKTISVSKNHKTWRFWNILQIQSLCTWSFLHLAVYNTLISVLDKPICIFGKKPNFWKFWEVAVFC